MSAGNGLPDDSFERSALIYGSYPPQPILESTGTKHITTIAINPVGRINSVTDGSGSATPLFALEITSTTPYAVPTGNVAVFASASSGADLVADLPAATGSGYIALFTKEDANAHNIIITAAGSDLINGNMTYTLTTQYSAVWLIDKSAGVWRIIGVVAM
jgi:hypothetical protein